MTCTTDRPTVCRETPHARGAKFIEDKAIEKDLRGLANFVKPDNLTPPGTVVCTDETHSGEWANLSVYAIRKRLGLSRTAVADAMAERCGVDVGWRDVRDWERNWQSGDAPGLLKVRALAVVLGVPVGAFVGCGQCEAAAHVARGGEASPPRGPRDSDIWKTRLPVAVREEREARAWTQSELAKAAKVRRRYVVRMERGIFDGLPCNAALRILGTLNLDSDGALGLCPDGAPLATLRASKGLTIEAAARLAEIDPASAAQCESTDVTNASCEDLANYGVALGIESVEETFQLVGLRRRRRFNAAGNTIAGAKAVAVPA